MPTVCESCANGCTAVCGKNCVAFCAEGCYLVCSQDCTGTCKGSCSDTCRGTCEGNCKRSCKSECDTMSAIGNGVDWTELEKNDIINITAQDWNKVVDGFYNYHSGINADKAQFNEPISASIYNSLFTPLAWFFPEKTEFIELAVDENEFGALIGAISKETIITAKHFSIIGELFNNLPPDKFHDE